MAKKAAKKTAKKVAKKTAKKAPAKKGAKKPAKKAAPAKEVLVVASKVKAYIKSKGFMCSSDAVVAISDQVYSLIDDACARTEANRRSTVKPQDL